MIKLKKIVAVALTAAMCLGMSVTAFAKVDSSIKTWDSPIRMDNLGKTWNDTLGAYTPNGDGELPVVGNGAVIRRVTDQNGVDLEVNAKLLSTNTLNSINSEKKVRDILKDAGYDVSDDYDLIPVLATELTLDAGLGANGAYAWVDLNQGSFNPAEYSAGQVIQVLRETYAGSGEWEVVDAELVETDGQLRARVQLTNKSQSLVVIRVMEDGRTVRILNRKTGASVTVPANQVTTGTSTSAAASTSPSASPKTGEF